MPVGFNGGKILERFFRLGYDGLGTFDPVCGTHIAVLFLIFRILVRPVRIEAVWVWECRLTWNLNAFSKRRVSSTDRPTGKSLIDICLATDQGMRQRMTVMANFVPQHPIGVDEELSPKGDALVLDEHTVVAGDAHVPICDQGQFEVRSEAALLSRLVGPREVSVLRIGGHG